MPVHNSLALYEALIAHKIPVEMHLYPTGGHGFGLALDKGHVAGWTDRCIEWLASLDAD